MTSLDPGFRFNGSTSDLAQQWYRRHLEGDFAAPLSLMTSPLPDAIQTRLDAAGVSFDSLPGLLQRALVWDSGFAISPRNTLIELLTLDGINMAEIAVPMSDYETAGCQAQNCTQPEDNLVWYKSSICNGQQMNSVSRCLSAEFDGGSEVHLSMWSTGGNENVIPEMRLLKHMWRDGNNSYLVYAVHTARSSEEPALNNCAGDTEDQYAPGLGSIVIPCYPMSKITPEMVETMKKPEPGSLVTAWLSSFANSSSGSNTQEASQSDDGGTTNSDGKKDSGGFNTVLLIPIIIAVLVIIGIIWWFIRRKKVAQSKGLDVGTPGIGSALISPNAVNLLNTGKHTGTGTGTKSSTGMTTVAVHADDYDSASSNSVMKILLGDPNLVNSRLLLDQIQFDKLLSKGAFGEVWVCIYEGQKLAVKRLLQNKQHSFEDVEDFTREIQLSASLQHPNIVSFVGVAWNSLENLVMAVEFLPSGDLQNYLSKNGDLLSWSKEKIRIAIGLTSALEYMHARSPALIHRDLKSKNVLLSEDLQAKLIDFGVSKGKKDMTMTAGVGTPFWTAPEVLEGTRYTEKSDIYSFGVLLTELDTCQLPYHDAIGADGEKLKHFQILNSVMAGSLRPSVTPECPERIRKIVAACLHQDPAQRPSAPELVRMLDGK